MNYFVSYVYKLSNGSWGYGNCSDVIIPKLTKEAVRDVGKLLREESKVEWLTILSLVKLEE